MAMFFNDLEPSTKEELEQYSKEQAKLMPENVGFSVPKKVSDEIMAQLYGPEFVECETMQRPGFTLTIEGVINEKIKDPREKQEKTIKGTNARGDFTIEPDPRGKSLSSIFKSTITTEGHGAEHSKPVLWLKMIIGNCTSGDVFDPFAGSGTTIIACKSIGRGCRAIEKNPLYVDVIVRRYKYFCEANELQLSILKNGIPIDGI